MKALKCSEQLKPCAQSDHDRQNDDSFLSVLLYYINFITTSIDLTNGQSYSSILSLDNLPLFAIAHMPVGIDRSESSTSFL